MSTTLLMSGVMPYMYPRSDTGLTTRIKMLSCLSGWETGEDSTGQPAPIGISVFGPSELPHNVQPGSNLEIKLNAECTPGISAWPTYESYFDIFWFVSQNEYVIDRPLGQAAYIWGYLASREKL